MTDDPKVIHHERFAGKRLATVTGEVPSECPDRFKRSDDLRNIGSLPADLIDCDALDTPGPTINPRAGYDPLVALRVKELLDLQTRLVLAMAEMQSVLSRLQEVTGAALGDDDPTGAA